MSQEEVEEFKRRFGRHLRTLRRTRDWTQEELAEKAGISVDFVSLLERGRFGASFEILLGLAKALEMGVKELFDF